MKNLKVVANNKPSREREQRQIAFRCCQDTSKYTLSKSFARPLLKVEIPTGKILIDRLTERYSNK